MYNFTHKPFIPDGENMEQIANKILEKSRSMRKNKLQFLLKKQLDTSLISVIQQNEINDFPEITPKKLYEKITLGTFQLKAAKSYLDDFEEEKPLYIITKQLVNQIKHPKLAERFKNSKTIGCEIASRHHRGVDKIKDKIRVIYRVFLQYKPEITGRKSIIGWVCNCKNGRRRLGCCSHVAAFIYYLGYAREHELKSPAKYLNKVFIDLDKKEQPNRPRLVKRRRGRRYVEYGPENYSSPSESESEYSDFDDDDFDPFDKSYDEKDKRKDKGKDKDRGKNDNNNNNGGNNLNNNQINPNDFVGLLRSRVPAWGGQIMFQNRQINLTNSCTIDNFLLSLWFSTKIDPNFTNNIPNLRFRDELTNVINRIENNDWNGAKQIWILEILQPRINGRNLSLWGSETSKYVEPLQHFQQMNVIQYCNPNCPYNNTVAANYSVHLYSIRQNNVTIIDPQYTGTCNTCNTIIATEVQLNHRPNFLLVQTTNREMRIDYLPKDLIIDNMNYRLVSCTLHSGNHFLGVFLINDRFYLVDDLTQRVTLLETFDPNNRDHVKRTSDTYHYFRFLYVNVSYYMRVEP
jgi:hypothetical protein